MRFKVLGSNKLVWLNTSKYLIKWDNKSLSKPQYEVKQWLKPFWQGQIVLEEMKVPRTRLKCDFVNLTKKIIIEFNGQQHNNFHFFHGGSRFKYLSQIKRDVEKRKWAELNGFTFVEIFDDDLPLTKEFFLKNYSITI